MPEKISLLVMQGKRKSCEFHTRGFFFFIFFLLLTLHHENVHDFHFHRSRSSWYPPNIQTRIWFINVVFDFVPSNLHTWCSQNRNEWIPDFSQQVIFFPSRSPNNCSLCCSINHRFHVQNTNRTKVPLMWFITISFRKNSLFANKRGNFCNKKQHAAHFITSRNIHRILAKDTLYQEWKNNGNREYYLILLLWDMVLVHERSLEI